MSKRRGPTPPRKWETMVPTERVFTGDSAQWQNLQTLLDAHPELRDRFENLECWGNAIYSAHVDRYDDGSVAHISFHRRDKKPVTDWRHKQRIKNDIAGPEAEAMELFPAQSRVVDTSNEFHLWVMPLGHDIPIGWDTEQAQALQGDATLMLDIGAVQREEAG